MEEKHLFKKDNNYIILNLKNMKIFKLPTKLNSLLDGMSEQELKEVESKLTLEKDNDEQKQLTIHKENKNICKRLILNVSNSCNLACKYCYAEEGKYATNQELEMMNIDTLKKAIEAAYDIYSEGIEMIQFFGGEPLLNKKLLSVCIPEINSIVERRKMKKPKYTIVTNGTLIDDDYIKLFNEHFESITISLDGEKEVNDCNRCFANNNSSVYDVIMKNIKKMNEKKRNFYLAVEATITKKHIDNYKKTGRIDTFYLLRDLELDAVQHGPLIDKKLINTSLSHADENDVIDYFEQWIKNEFSNGEDKIRCRTIANIINMYNSGQVYSNGCGATKSDLAVDVTGNMYPCFMFIGIDKFIIGNVTDFDINKYKDRRGELAKLFMEANNNDKCNSCWIKGMCEKTYGHCIGARYLQNNDISKPIDLACEISRNVLERIIFEVCKRYGSKRK